MNKHETVFEKAIETVRSKSTGEPLEQHFEITINFHPDRITKEGLPLLVSIAQDQRLKSQFETETSNGGLTAFFGGDRWRWEQRVFNGVYDTCDPRQRPKYGALNYKNFEVGASSRFGSSFFRLKPHMIKRTTFCYPDSFFEPEHFASHQHLASLIEVADVDSLDELDSYIEAQIHGEIDLKNDIEAIVLDPAYQGTDIEFQAQLLPVAVEWHSGFELDTGIMAENSEYRGQEFVELAKQIAIKDSINPQILGFAINRLGYDQQDIKKVWHYLARFGDKSKRA